MNLYPLQPGALYVLDQGWAIFRMVRFKSNLKMYTKMGLLGKVGTTTNQNWLFNYPSFNSFRHWVGLIGGQDL